MNAASVALMAAVSLKLARAALVDLPSVLLLGAAGFLLARRVNSAWLVVGAAAFGALRGAFLNP